MAILTRVAPDLVLAVVAQIPAAAGPVLVARTLGRVVADPVVVLPSAALVVAHLIFIARVLAPNVARPTFIAKAPTRKRTSNWMSRRTSTSLMPTARARTHAPRVPILTAKGLTRIS